MRVLICYDGSADAQAAIARAGQLLPGRKATVLVVWETIVETMTRTGSMGLGYGMAGSLGDVGDDSEIEKWARDTATAGAQLARVAGLGARPRIVERREAIAADILAVAAEEDADVIVLGTRGRGGIKSLMLGSVSEAVLHHADRPVLVIPSPALAEDRHQSAEPVELMHDSHDSGSTPSYTS
jgi:nucleotide-binding universal stress UspA family protein